MPPLTSATVSGNIEQVILAADEDDWRGAVKAARSVPPQDVASFLGNTGNALRAAWIASYAPLALNVEFARIFAADLPQGLREENVAPAFSAALFEAGAKAFRIALGTAPSRTTIDAAIVMLLLPGASRSREARLRELLVDVVDHIVSAQSLASGRPVAMDCDTARRLLGLAPALHASLSPADLYPGLSLVFLTDFLRVAQSPALRAWTHEYVLSAWSDLMEIVETRGLLRELSPDAEDWIRRVTQLDPEETAPGEFAEEE